MAATVVQANSSDYSVITELPGCKLTAEQLRMICCRYETAGRFVEGKDVLEVGCGSGLGLGYLLDKGAGKVVGGDINEKSLEIAREYYDGRVELVGFDAHSLPFEDCSFDVVLLFEVIFYFKEPAVCISEIRRVLKDDGVLILCLPNKELPGFIGSAFSFQYFSVSQLYELLNDCFSDVEVFGAFALDVNSAKDKLRLVRLNLAKLFNYVPGGTWLKERLKRKVMGKNITLGNEIPYEQAGDCELEPLDKVAPDFNHQLLYAICHV